MTRIVAGTAGGRTLAVPPRGTRPTSERVREAIFSRLDHYDVVSGAVVLDLFAGSGALGLEASSRGAAAVTLVDLSRGAIDVCRRNVDSLGLSGVRTVMDRAERFVATPPPAPWDLVFIDPPYDLPEIAVDGLLAALAEPGAVADGAVVVVERSKRSAPPALPVGWETLAHKDYGETSVWYVGPELDEPA